MHRSWDTGRQAASGCSGCTAKRALQRGRKSRSMAVAWPIVLASARRSSVTSSRSWKVSAMRSTRPLACGERAKIFRDSQFLQCSGELGGVRRRLRLAGVVLEDGVAIAVERQGNAPALDQALQQHEVASGVLTGAKHGALTTPPVASSMASSSTKSRTRSSNQA